MKKKPTKLSYFSDQVCDEDLAQVEPNITGGLQRHQPYHLIKNKTYKVEHPSQLLRVTAVQNPESATKINSASESGVEHLTSREQPTGNKPTSRRVKKSIFQKLKRLICTGESR